MCIMDEEKEIIEIIETEENIVKIIKNDEYIEISDEDENFWY